jgi:signal transduction histidine kinase
MDADTQARIFDPYFTTKTAGHGLGMAAVSGVVRGHGASIRIETQPGVGTRFVILFPASHRSVAAPPEPSAPGSDIDIDIDGTILVVDR